MGIGEVHASGFAPGCREEKNFRVVLYRLFGAPSYAGSRFGVCLVSISIGYQMDVRDFKGSDRKPAITIKLGGNTISV